TSPPPLAVRPVPAPQKVVEVTDLGLQRLADVVLEQDAVVLGDELAVHVEVLRAFDGKTHVDVVDVVLGPALATSAPTLTSAFRRVVLVAAGLRPKGGRFGFF